MSNANFQLTFIIFWLLKSPKGFETTVCLCQQNTGTNLENSSKYFPPNILLIISIMLVKTNQFSNKWDTETCTVRYLN